MPDPVHSAIELRKGKNNLVTGGHGAPGTVDEFIHAHPYSHKSGLKPTNIPRAFE